MSFNPLDHPLMFSYPPRAASDATDSASATGAPAGAGAQLAPLAMLLVDLLRPASIVELGRRGDTASGAFGQAVKDVGADCQCVAIGLPRPGNAPEIGAEARADDVTLPMPFDEALAQFADGSVDLLHIADLTDLAGLAGFAGSHPGATDSADANVSAARRAFETWLPKMSARGVVVLEGLEGLRQRDVRDEGAEDGGAGTLWDQLTARYPHHLALTLGQGQRLGIVAVGGAIPECARALLDLSGEARETFGRLMQALSAQITEREALRALRAEVERLRRTQQAHDRQLATVERNHAAALSMETARSTALEASLLSTKGYIRALESSPGVRLIKLAQASGTVLRRKGPFALAKHVGQWALGRRGYHLRDLEPQTEDLANPSTAVYQAWAATQRTLPEDLEEQRVASQRFALRPLISVVVPVFNPDPRILEETISSVLAQTYDHWELCLADGGSTTPDVRETLQRFAAQDARIHVQLLEENHGIAGNSNAAVAMAGGEFVTLLDHDDLLEPDLLYHVVAAINQTPEVDVVYYDENRISADGDQYYPLPLKPAWSPDLLLSTPFTTHCTIRRQLILDLGGFNPALDGTQDWDLFLRLSERTQRFVRVPRILYHWRMVRGSAAASVDAKPEVFARQLTAIGQHMTRVTGREATARWFAPGIPRVTWTPEPTPVSIIIPTKDKVGVLRRCVTSILKKTTYRHYDLVLVDTGSVEQATFTYYAALATQMQQMGKRLTIVHYEGAFNYSRACNIGAQQAEGSSLLFMNNDMEILDADWLEELVRWSNLPEIGVVGAKLLYPDRRIQHAGVIIGSVGLAGHIYYGAEEHAASVFGSVNWYRDYLAVTGALHMMRRDVYDTVGGYDESYDISYSDVALCYRVAQRGFRVLYDPFVRLLHYESQTRDSTPSMDDMRKAAAELAATVEGGDPYFSPHLSQQQAMPQLKRAGELTSAQMLERLVGLSVVTLVEQRDQAPQPQPPREATKATETAEATEATEAAQA